MDQDGRATPGSGKMIRSLHVVCSFVSAGAVLLLLSTTAVAQAPARADGPQGKSRSLDQQLLDDLDRELLKGLSGGAKPKLSTPPQSDGLAKDAIEKSE